MVVGQPAAQSRIHLVVTGRRTGARDQAPIRVVQREPHTPGRSREHDGIGALGPRARDGAGDAHGLALQAAHLAAAVDAGDGQPEGDGEQHNGEHGDTDHGAEDAASHRASSR